MLYEPMAEIALCRFDEPIGTDPECYTVTVPEDRSDPSGRQVTLAVAVFPATNGDDGDPPVVYLEGGPGGEILETITFAYEPVFATLNRNRALVLFDQRGTGFSEPSLACDELTDLAFDLLAEDLEVDEITRLRLDALAPCRDRWAADGIDLSHYNSAASAADAADIREALGYEEWDLYGVSYGTRLALTIMRDQPEGVRSVILDSTYPPEIDGVAFIPETADRALTELYAACTADAVCSATYGDLEDLLFRVVDDLNATPADISVRDVFTGQSYQAILTGDDVLGVTFQALYSDELLREIPEMLLDAEDGIFFKMELIISIVLANQQFFAIGQNFSVQCHEEVPFSTPEAVAATASAFPRLAALTEGAFTQSGYAFEFCPTWGAGVGADYENDPVVSSIPTLVVAGQFDPITPPEFGAAVASRLENATFIEYPALGHGVATFEGCPVIITLRFLDDPTAPVDASCVAEMPPVSFTVFTGDTSVTLESVTTESEGVFITVDVPTGWEDVGFGAFYRDADGADETAVVVQAFPDETFVEFLLDAYSSQLGGDDGQLDEIEPITIAGREWRRFSDQAFGLSVELALTAHDGFSIAVMLIAEPREAAGYTDSVLLPALSSIEVDT